MSYLDRDGARRGTDVVRSAGERDDLSATGHLLQVIYRNDGVAEELSWVGGTKMHVCYWQLQIVVISGNIVTGFL